MKKSSEHENGGLMNTIIGRDTNITGTLDVKGALRVDGGVNGKIICSDTVTVGASGKVEAEIEADTAIVAGKLTGNIQASEKVELQANCEMQGDLRTKSLVIEEGAVFCGACNMKDQGPNLDFLKEGKPTAKPEASKEKKQ